MANPVKQYVLPTPAKATQIERFQPFQGDVQGSIADRIQNLLGQETSFEPIAQQAMRQYQEQTLPAIKNQFSNPGASSAYQNAIARGASNLQGNLAALQSNYNLEQQKLIPALGKLALEPQFETIYEPGVPSQLQDLTTQLLPKLGQKGVDLLLDKLGLGTTKKDGEEEETIADKVIDKTGKAIVNKIADKVAPVAGGVGGAALAGTGTGAGAGAGAGAATGAGAGAGAGAAAPAGAGGGILAGLGKGIAAAAPWAMGAAALAGLAYGLWDMGKSIFTPSKGDKNMMRQKELLKQKGVARKEYEKYAADNPKENLPSFKDYVGGLKKERNENKTKFQDYVKQNAKQYKDDSKIIKNKAKKFTPADIAAAQKRVDEYDEVKKAYKTYTKSLPAWLIV